MQTQYEIHNAFFPLNQCQHMAENLLKSGKYESVSIEDHIGYCGKPYAKVIVKPKQTESAQVLDFPKQ